MKKLLLATLTTLLLTGCLDQYVPSNIEYKGQPESYFHGVGEWILTQWSTDVFSCIDGFIYDQSDLVTTINDAAGVPIQCSPVVEIRINMVKT